MARNLILFFYFFFYTPFFLFANSPEIEFEHIGVEHGLSNNNITWILQDSYGFMWFGTEEGLNKYDGYQLKVYRHDPEDSLSLKSNWITSLYEDRSSVLWITTLGSGLFKYDREKENFIRYNPPGLTAITIEQVIEYKHESQDIRWIGGYNGLFKIDLATSTCIHYPHTDKGTPYNWVQTITLDSIGNVWIGTRGDGLHKFNPETEQYRYYRHNPHNPTSLSNNTIMSLHMDKTGILWIGTDGGGLNKFDDKKDHFEQYKYDPGDPKSLSSNNIFNVYEDRSGILWIGTKEEGLNRFDSKTGQFTHFKSNPGVEGTLSDNTVINIFEDKTGVFWIGTYGGLNKFDPQKTEFSGYKKIPGDQNSLCDNYITSIDETIQRGKKILWIGTKNGLSRLDRISGKVTSYQHDPSNNNSIPSNKINSIFEDRSGILWIGTIGDGLIKFNSRIQKFTHYTNDSSDPETIRGNWIRDVYEDKYGDLWIGTTPNGLSKLDRESEKFIQVGERKNTMQIFEDKMGELWFATWPGLRKLDRETGEYQVYWRNREASNYPELNRHNCIHESNVGERDILWVGSYNGLNKFDRKTGNFFTYTVKDGLPNNVINGILEDSQGNLWLSTNNGLSRFNPITEEFRNFDINDGLLSNQFFPGAYYKSIDGEMFFGTAKGLIYFYPEKLIDNSHIPDIVITDFNIFNEPVAIRNKNENGNKNIFYLPKHISLINKIELSYQQNVFSFEFSALDYRSPQKNQFAYKMEGVDPDWVFTDASRRFATYTNLDHGEYLFKVKGSNNNGLWNEEGTSLTIIITPPWWQTNLAYAIYIFLFGLALLGFWRFQLNRIRMKHKMELDHIHTEKLEEVDRLKSRFFANISHEFRTPLTLIKGPVEQLLSEGFKDNTKKKFRMILRNSDRLLGLINQLLDLSKLESGKMELRVAETNLVKFIKGLTYSFSSLAESKKIIFKINIEDEDITGYIDRDKLEKIIINLLSNAFKFTPEKGIISVAVKNPNAKIQMSNEFPIPNSQFQITISNTGLGIPPDRLNKIFDRFYQADTTYKKDSEGSGIGLALTKELVELHHGTIEVECRRGTMHSALKTDDSFYTTFTVLLPIGKEHLSNDEIIESSSSDVSDHKPQISHPTSHITDAVSRIPHRESSIQDPVSRILLVEDNPDVTTYICSILERDYRIVTAVNGKDGTERALEWYPDLIISDVMMPEMDGFELCHKLKSDEKTSHIPIILLTAKADLDSKIEGLEFGADDYINKPFEARELQVRIKNLIEQRKKLQEIFSQTIELNPAEITASSMDEKFIKRLLDVFENHVAESDFSTEDFAREVGMSRSNLHRKLQALTNQPTHEFLRTLRLKRAADMIKKSAGTVTEIAYAVGFSNPSYFSKMFRQQFGQTPSQFASKNQ